jgi:hypothetical protein
LVKVVFNYDTGHSHELFNLVVTTPAVTGPLP